MKKLMFAVAALAAGVACAEITSANIVGYSTYGLTKANQFVTSMFKNVGANTIDLTTVKVVGYTGASSDKATIQFIDATGNLAKDENSKDMMFYWRDADGKSGKWIRKDGRKNVDINAGDVLIGSGDALWCQKEADGLSLQFAGEVVMSQTEVALSQPNQAVGNMMAVPVDLTTLKVAGYTGATTDKVTIQVIDATGNLAKDEAGKDKMYYWRDADGNSGKWIKKDGRKNVDVESEEVVMQPGDGLWVQNNETSVAYKLVFAAPSL